MLSLSITWNFKMHLCSWLTSNEIYHFSNNSLRAIQTRVIWVWYLKRQVQGSAPEGHLFLYFLCGVRKRHVFLKMSLQMTLLGVKVWDTLFVNDTLNREPQRDAITMGLLHKIQQVLCTVITLLVLSGSIQIPYH